MFSGLWDLGLLSAGVRSCAQSDRGRSLQGTESAFFVWEKMHATAAIRRCRWMFGVNESHAKGVVGKSFCGGAQFLQRVSCCKLLLCKFLSPRCSLDRTSLFPSRLASTPRTAPSLPHHTLSAHTPHLHHPNQILQTSQSAQLGSQHRHRSASAALGVQVEPVPMALENATARKS